MYEERREKFTVKDVILQILLIVLFVLLLFWLFPSKGALKKTFEKEESKNEKTTIVASADDLDRITVAHNRIFADNIFLIKENAILYFSGDKLPKDHGKTIDLTLKQMYDKELITEVFDEENKSCDANNSYVSITKRDNEYDLKVNLSCGTKQDSITTTLGEYEYCSNNGICEKQVQISSDTKDMINSDKNNNPTNTEENKVNDKKEEKKDTSNAKFVCEYSKDVGGFYGPYGDWSEWSKEEIKATNLIFVETKIEKEQTGEKVDKVESGTKIETYVSDYKEEEYISDYKVKKEITGYKNEKYISGYDEKKVLKGYKVEKYIKTYKVEKYVSGKTTSGKPIYSIKKIPVYATKKVAIYETKKVPKYSEKKVPIYKETKTPVYSTKKVPVYGTKEVTAYKEVKVPTYDEVTYYRYKTKKYYGVSAASKWSTCEPIDTSLTGDGYILTGEKKES